MYRVTYHTQIPADLNVIDTAAKRRIKQAIESKLTVDPIRFGKPLQHSLTGLRALRVGDYRIVYQLTKTEVYIVLIAHRTVVYQTAKKRNS
ncbi:MAG TPA: type II toxin-antitoxin system RelE/ParE family toxin [Candidatus Paceibacterota bacterium]|nr:type II toxin-antitoxin system RelE/ParE family toxin [Candidatus Paceibacterota bacterium]